MTRVLKIAFHVHSDWSYDGQFSLEELSQLFGRKGYDFVMLCEHCRTFDADRWFAYKKACKQASVGAKLMPGIEYSDPRNIVHLPTWGLKEFAGSEVATDKVIELVERYRALSVFAHPSRKDAWSLFDAEWGKVLSGYEFWNRKTDGLAPSRNSLRLQDSLTPFLSLDFHTKKQIFPFVTYVRVESTDEEELIEKLRSGQFLSRVAGLPIQCFNHRLLRQSLLALNHVKQSSIIRKIFRYQQ